MVCDGTLLLVAGFATVHSWHAPPEDRQTSPQIDDHRRHPTKSDRSEGSSDRAGAAFVHRDPEQWLAEILARNPGLEPEWRNVPDHENGFLQWLELSEQYQVDGEIGSDVYPIPPGITAILHGNSPWDAEALEAFMNERREFIEEVTRIGLLPDQSTAGIDIKRWSFVGARFSKQISDILLADARLAAESGDHQRALKRVQAAQGLARHYEQIEPPACPWQPSPF